MDDIHQFGFWSDSGEDILKSQFPLHRACRDGDLDALSILLSSENCDFYEEDEFYGWTPMHWAAYFGKLTCLMRMTEHGANCDASTGRFNQTPTHMAAFGGKGHCLKWLLHCGSLINRQLECIRKLSSKGINIDVASTRFGQTAVHLCAFADHPHCLQWILLSGSCIDSQDYLGETPVHKSARTGSMECVSLLVSQGAKLSLRNHSGNTPSQVAIECGFQECANYLERAMQIQQQATGVYDELRAPVTQPSIVNNCLHDGKVSPQKCLILHGLNGGLIPNPSSNGTTGETTLSSNGLSEETAFSSDSITRETILSCNGGIRETTDMDIDESDIYQNGSADQSSNGIMFTKYHMNGDGDIYTSAHTCMNGYENKEQSLFSGLRRKRGCDEENEESIKRCRIGASDSILSEADAHNNNIVSSYHAILSISTSPVIHAAESSLQTSASPISLFV